MSTQDRTSAAMLSWDNEAEATDQLPAHVEVRACKQHAAWSRSFDAPAAMQGDVSKVMQILFNLANNAMKWSSGAPVTVHVAVTDEPALALTGMRMLVINVADRGPGLTDEQRESIFRPFSRANPETAGGPGGAGIGLHLSRSFARALGGDVSVHSVLGEGATFTMTVPVRLLSAEEAERLSSLAVSDVLV